MLSALAALPASCDLLASYAAVPLAAARNKAPGFQASVGVRKWVEGATVTVEYENAGACTLSAVDEPALAQGALDLPRASVSVLSHAPPKFSLTMGPTPTNAACASDGGWITDPAGCRALALVHMASCPVGVAAALVPTLSCGAHATTAAPKLSLAARPPRGRPTTTCSSRAQNIMLSNHATRIPGAARARPCRRRPPARRASARGTQSPSS